MKTTYILGLAAIAIAGGAYLFTSGQAAPEPPTERPMASVSEDLVQVTLPDSLSAEAQIGKRGFDAICAACHGVNGAGRDGAGPPLIHKIYEPSHHGDMSFYLAVQRGVVAHHWRFGNMPPQEGLTEGDVKAIVTYVREVQRANGIN